MDLAALRHNVRTLQERAPDADLMAVVKADAYGHGAVPVAQTLYDEGVRHFAVARPAEGVRLRREGVSGRILVLGAPFPDNLGVYTTHDLDITISSEATATAVCTHAAESGPVRVHLKVDTGMGRIGLPPSAAESVLSTLAAADDVQLAGLWTHFATADEPDSAFAQTQLRRFEALLDQCNVHADRIHAANTGALLTIGSRAYDFSSPLIRTGIALYGLTARSELDEWLDLRPVMHLHARVTHVKTVSAGTPISYGARWEAPKTTRIATLGVGYGDGYPRRASGRASVRIGEHRCPVVGEICMDMCMIDLGRPDESPATEVEVGDEVVLFGPGGPSLHEVAKWSETIPYEICCGLSPRVPRKYVGRDVDTKTASPCMPPVGPQRS